MKDLSDLILYKASAGSGKTYTLAKEYLKIILLNPADYNKILAVTFTKKATAEMKSRIIDYLTMLEKKDDKVANLRKSIIEEIKNSKEIDISEYFDKHVHDALQLILHDYSNFNISTIDSFFQSIIRSFTKELDLPVGMEVELDTDAVIHHAVDEMLKEYKSDKDTFSRWLEEYVFDLIEEDKSWKIEKNIAKLAKQLLSEEYQLLASTTTHRFEIETYKLALNEIRQIISAYKKKLDDLIRQFEQKVTQGNIDLTVFKGKITISSFVKKTKNHEPEFTATLQNMLNSDEILSKENSKDSSLKIQYESIWFNTVKPFLVSVYEHQQSNEKKYNSAEIVLKNIYSLALLEFINLKIKEYKSDKNLILISDTNQIVSLIAQHEEVPFIFEKSASFLKYILIDEFQDTSSLQWKGVLPLLLEILQNVRGLVLIVGDPKQSIYRWRGGKMELIIDGIAPDLSYHWDERKDISLKDNYRSAKEIVEFNNAFFSTLKNQINLQNKLFKEVLSDVEQEIIKINKTGFVQCKWLEKDEGEEDIQLEEVLKIIQSLETTKRYSDIAVLTRNNKLGSAVANYLEEHQIPVVSAESLLLQNQLEIKLLVAALQYVYYTKEKFYTVKLNYLYAQFLQKENTEQYLVSEGSGNYFFEEQMPDLNRNKVQQFSSVAVNELVFKLMNILGLDVQSNSYLLRFQDVVYSYIQKYSTSVSDFLEYWNEQQQKLSIIPPEGINAVKIYTIHKAKGLQFPVVIVPYADWNMKPKSDSTIWIKSDELPFSNLNVFPVEMTKKLENSLFEADFHKEMELNYIDNINLLYVAFTRAEEQLYILSTAEKVKAKDVLPQNVSRLLKSTISGLSLKDSIIDVNAFSYGSINTGLTAEDNLFQLQPLTPVVLQDFKIKIPLATKSIYNDAQVKGNLVHDILSKIKQPGQLKKAIATTVTEEEEFYSEATQKVMDVFVQHEWFDDKWQHINERNILYKNKLLRPDKVLLSKDECVIIDYKTGAKEPAHIQQMKEYIEVYRSFNMPKVSAYLIYIENAEILEVQ